LVVVAFAGAPGNLTSATRIAFAQSQQPRNQTQPQEGLPPDKKTQLSRMGPEEIFGVTGEGDSRNRPTGKQQQRKQQPTAPLPSPPPQRRPVTSAGAPSAQPTAPPVQSSTPAPSPTAVAGALENGLQSTTLGQVGSSDKILPKWATPTLLITTALALLGALFFTLIKLFEKIREGSSG
jgi:hypothetical protein